MIPAPIEVEPICFEDRKIDYCQGPDASMTQVLGASACRYCIAAMSREVRRDDLTDLINRRGLREYFDTFASGDKPFGAIGIDLKKYKGVNEAHGQDAGDEMLSNIARFLEDQTRPGEDMVVGRRSGDEFVIFVSLESRVVLRGEHLPTDESDEDRLLGIAARIETNFMALPIVEAHNAGIPDDANRLGLKYRTCMYQPGTSLKDFLIQADPKQPTE